MRNCDNHKMEYVKRVKKNGQPLLNKQCLNCGYHDAKAYKVILVNMLITPFFNERLKEIFYIKKSEYKNQLIDEQKEYYNSEKWKSLRKLVIERDKNECSFCDNVGTDVHHTTYENWKNENINELILLCRNCHINIHELMPDLGYVKEKYSNYEND